MVGLRLSQRAYAASRKERGLPGGSLSGVRKAIASGRIQKGPDGLIDVAAADAAWEHAILPDARIRRNVARMAKGKRPKGGDDGFASARTRHEIARAELAELEVGRRRGDLLAKEDVWLGWSRLVLDVRSAFLGLPSRVAPRVASMVDQDEFRQILGDEIREILHSLARGSGSRKGGIEHET